MKKISLLLAASVMVCSAAAQDDLLKELDSKVPINTYAESAFKGSRLVNGQTVETRGKGELEFIFSHRFGAMNSGSYNLYGLDQAAVRLGLEYGFTDRLGVGFGRSSSDKMMDFYARYKILRQHTGATNMPVTVTGFGYTSVKLAAPGDATSLNDRTAYVAQLLIARKFSPKLSLQIMPTFVHKNAVDKTIESNDQLAIGFGGRFKMSRSIAITSEYYHRLNVKNTNSYQNSVGFGVDIETGGHVFQLMLSSSQRITERTFITESTGDFFNGDIHLGFNVTRAFQLKKKKIG
ncbi:MAG: DUF5777 family beta-barrel protein [Cyclobacteriaceae bacterium]|nr:DUF5777 family beta-barrel protein [Cyclobacteriaceae bacterium]